MEGPGGYQFVGRTLQMWNRFHETAEFEPGKPWLLRFFDQIRFYPVSEAELTRLREDFLQGRFQLRIEETTLDLAAYNRFVATNADSIAAFKTRQVQAFEEERERWRAAGAAEFQIEPDDMAPAQRQHRELPPGCAFSGSPVTGNVWRVQVAAGDRIEPGQVLVIMEAMKMEVPVVAESAGVVVEVLCGESSSVAAGEPLVVVRADAA
jgi:urea carboxylase